MARRQGIGRDGGGVLLRDARSRTAIDERQEHDLACKLASCQRPGDILGYIARAEHERDPLETPGALHDQARGAERRVLATDEFGRRGHRDPQQAAHRVRAGRAQIVNHIDHWLRPERRPRCQARIAATAAPTHDTLLVFEPAERAPRRVAREMKPLHELGFAGERAASRDCAIVERRVQQLVQLVVTRDAGASANLTQVGKDLVLHRNQSLTGSPRFSNATPQAAQRCESTPWPPDRNRKP